MLGGGHGPADAEGQVRRQDHLLGRRRRHAEDAALRHADEVRREVRERIEIFGRGGGFVFNTVHNVQAGTPVENLVALYETVRETR